MNGATRLSSFLEQAVNGKLSFATLLTLLKIASEKDCRRVRYLSPPPQDYGAFFMPTAKPIDPETWTHRINEPEEMTLNQLCEATLVVVRKIADYDNARAEAVSQAAESKRETQILTEKNEHLNILLKHYAPELFAYDDGYLP